MQIKTSKKEITDLIKAWLAISLAFAILESQSVFSRATILIGLPIAMLTVGVGFICHEMSHKFLAQKYGCMAEFRSNDFMLLVAILMSFTGFLFAAPGAVMIHGNVGVARNGKISAAGIVANLIVAFVFLLLLLAFPAFNTIFYYGFTINSFLGLFNLIPLGNFDGVKVLYWSKKVYYSLAAVSILFVMLQYFI